MLPTELMAERDRLPDGLLEEIVEARAYERAHAAYLTHPKEARGALVDLVKALDFEGAEGE